jgi:hypothetical protein
MQDGNDLDEIFLVISSSVGGHLELSLVGELDLYFFRFPVTNPLIDWVELETSTLEV